MTGTLMRGYLLWALAFYSGGVAVQLGARNQQSAAAIFGVLTLLLMVPIYRRAVRSL